jgi:hypothetical protein
MYRCSDNITMNKCLLAVIVVSFVLEVPYLQSARKEAEQPSVNRHIFQNGDLIFRKGTGFFSGVFSKAGDRDTPYSHVGIIFVDREHIFVIHTDASELTGKGFARIERLEDFVDKKNSIYAGLYRLKQKSQCYGNKVTELALEYVKQRIPFDRKFDLTTENELYCSELVYQAYMKAGLNITDKLDIISFRVSDQVYKKEIVSIRGILDSRLFKLVGNIN